MFLIDVTQVQALPNRNLDRVVKNYTGVFAPLLQDEYFKQVTVPITVADSL